MGRQSKQGLIRHHWPTLVTPHLSTVFVFKRTLLWACCKDGRGQAVFWFFLLSLLPILYISDDCPWDGSLWLLLGICSALYSRLGFPPHCSVRHHSSSSFLSSRKWQNSPLLLFLLLLWHHCLTFMNYDSERKSNIIILSSSKEDKYIYCLLFWTK